MACAYLRWLAMTCAHFGRDQICTQVKATFSPFGHTTQVNSSWVTSMNLLLANEIEDSLPENVIFVTCMYLEGNLLVCLATQCKSLRKFNLGPPCDFLPVRLARALVFFSETCFSSSPKCSQLFLWCNGNGVGGRGRYYKGWKAWSWEFERFKIWTPNVFLLIFLNNFWRSLFRKEKKNPVWRKWIL